MNWQNPKPLYEIHFRVMSVRDEPVEQAFLDELKKVGISIGNV